jgi:hypothetical protein
MVSKSQDLLQTCLDFCDNSNESRVASDETIRIGNKSLNDFVAVNVLSAHTAYLLISVKTDDLFKAIYDVE